MLLLPFVAIDASAHSMGSVRGRTSGPIAMRVRPGGQGRRAPSLVVTSASIAHLFRSHLIATVAVVDVLVVVAVLFATVVNVMVSVIMLLLLLLNATVIMPVTTAITAVMVVTAPSVYIAIAIAPRVRPIQRNVAAMPTAHVTNFRKHTVPAR